MLDIPCAGMNGFSGIDTFPIAQQDICLKSQWRWLYIFKISLESCCENHRLWCYFLTVCRLGYGY